ncbi:MAG TPA: methyltransferase domain-containing protein [Dehalococcoidia bacterium]|nr:methyltransferase domain-containing protein [Dehalococcoidia bacterium]
MTNSTPICPACSGGDATIFYEVRDVPVHSCVLVRSRQDALDFPRGNLRLASCKGFGFIWNVDFDPTLLDYRQDYEETQGFSPTFNAFARQLAHDLVDRHDLRGKDVLEIGCGKGEFLALLAELGGNRGLGIDPSFAASRRPGTDASLTFIEDYYSEAYTHLTGDLIACRHTLEHVPNVADFVELTRTSAERRPGSIVFFEVPDTLRVLREAAFWDIYHEHCSYFTPGSLARLFRRSAFTVTDVALAYGDQYILLEATLDSAPAEVLPSEDGVGEMEALVDCARRALPANVDAWRTRLQRWTSEGKATVLWGAGSKAVAFLTTTGAGEHVAAAIDINPHKHDTFLPVTAHAVLSPERLCTLQPEVVIVMNRVYEGEVRARLAEMGLHPEVVAL